MSSRSGVKLSRGRHRVRTKTRSFATHGQSSRDRSSRDRSSRDYRDPPPPVTTRDQSLERRPVYSPPRISSRGDSPRVQPQEKAVPETFYLVNEKAVRAPSLDSQLTDDTEMEQQKLQKKQKELRPHGSSSSNNRHHHHRKRSSNSGGGRNGSSHQRQLSPDPPDSYNNELRGGGGRERPRSSRERDEPDAMAYQLHGGDVQPPSPVHRQKLNKWYRKQNPILSRSASHTTDHEEQTYASDDGGSHMSDGGSTHSVGTDAISIDEATDRLGREDYNLDTFRAIESMENDYLRTKQSVAYLAITLTAGQLLVLMLQLSMCGMAPFEVNGFVGPYPDAFSQWGGKNPYLMIQENEWWRLVTPSILNIGILHLLANSFCQLDAVALFEREWGSFRWLIVYLISSVGCTAFSSAFDPNTIAVGSSGALMGMYGAKLAQVTSLTCFEVKNFKVDEIVQLDQLSSVLCGLTLVSILSSFSYIDWSGHMGGLLCGFLSGIVLFSGPIQSCCTWFFWLLFGLLSLLGSLAGIFYLLIEKVTPDEDIADPCEYFRSFFPEDYNCDCLWE